MNKIATLADVATVSVTHELASRAVEPGDYLREKVALQELAARMVDAPEEVLPRFVEIAMEMTGGISAGLSLYEEIGAVFRWRYLQGALACFNEATTPRNSSPCGVTLDNNAPVLMSHPERIYGWISDANIKVPEVMLVPLYLVDKQPLGTLWIVSDTPGHFHGGHVRAASELASFVSLALRMMRSEQRLKQALEAEELLSREMSHRVNNLFAVTEGIVRSSARESPGKDDMTKVVVGRLHALARAHNLVQRGAQTVDTDLAALVGAVAAPYETREGEPRFSIKGPPVTCGAQTVNGLALVLYELATNAAKYGALAHGGRIAVDWTVDDGQLVFHWREQGGPRVTTAPELNGFGTKLLKDTITRQFSGAIAHDWSGAGLGVTLTLPLDKLAR